MKRKTNASNFFSGIRTKETTLETMVKIWDKIKVDFKEQFVEI
jgi:hypothetical protein